MFHAVVFDLDETLIDSPLDYQFIRRELSLAPGDGILESILELPPEIRQVRFEHLQRIEVAAAKQARIIDGVHEVLAELKRRRTPVALFTRNCRAATQAALRSTGLSFEKIITRDDAKAKPDPEGLTRLVAELSLKPQQVVYVGDYRFDVECGRRAQVRTAIFTNQTPEAETYGADYVFHHYREFFQVLPIVSGS